MPGWRAILILLALAACRGVVIGPAPEHACPPYCSMEP
jgi:hypothetical protein